MTPDEILAQHGPREAMEYDVAIVGAGPAGLATAIRLKQLAAERSHEISVVVLEKGSEPGAHILSGAIMDPRAINELIPDWKEKGAPLNQPVTGRQVPLLTETGATATPHSLLPDCFRNEGNYIISLGNVVRWLRRRLRRSASRSSPAFRRPRCCTAKVATCAASPPATWASARTASRRANFQLGMELHAKYTIFAEGSRGSLGRQLIARFKLDEGRDPQSYGLGLKELWEVKPERAEPGLTLHTGGWPLDTSTYGGSFLYHLDNNQVTLGFVVGLDYENPYLSPFEEFQRWKSHPEIRKTLEGGKRLATARARSPPAAS
jgi:electron-transferring-flavoprotein dehydrogenase